jgi:hypothetical protein
MNQINVERDAGSVLAHVREGMRVYDRDHGDIGRVDRVILPLSSDAGYEWGDGSVTVRDPTPPRDILLQEAAQVFEPDNLSEDLREHLLRRGFMRLSAPGIHAADRYVMPEKVDHIHRNRVILTVPRRDLINT